ncbi:MAG: acyloxyacyl hydrolase [Geobacteraceae bacterium]|nr:acyloxyacyl hydrolase [Geobacteraceae bacterium]
MRLNETAHFIFLLTSLFFIVLPASASAVEDNLKNVISNGEKGANSSPSSFSLAAPGFFSRLANPERKAAAISVASSYDPNFNMSSVRGSVAALYDHGELWDNVKSGTTAFKLEGVAGMLLRPEYRAVVSVNMLSLYYPEFVKSRELRPYLEAGIGVIYTDYRVDGQAYRHNFNPLLGIGAEIRGEKGDTFYVAMRLHHVSNGSINRDNQGVNSLLFQIGKFY